MTSCWDTALQGLHNQLRECRQKAGQLTLDILRGTKTGYYPATVDVPSVPMFDWRQLKHWNLSVDDLPEVSS
jgi:hypothetical protein